MAMGLQPRPGGNANVQMVREFHATPAISAWPSRAFPKSIGGVGEPLRHNQPSGPSEFELGRGLPQELGRASIMEEGSVLRIADGQQDAARRAQRRPAPGGAPQPDRLRRPGRSSSRRLECCRAAARGEVGPSEVGLPRLST